MKKDPTVFLGHILDSIELIESYSKNLMNSVGLQDKIIRRIEIIGEALKNLPADLRRDHPEVPWRDMAGMRDIVVHQYFGREQATRSRLAPRAGTRTRAGAGGRAQGERLCGQAASQAKEAHGDAR
jgi:uncharacterized protein with HEPN domain